MGTPLVAGRFLQYRRNGRSVCCGRSNSAGPAGPRPEPLRRPGIQAARHRWLLAAAFGRDVQPDDFGIGRAAWKNPTARRTVSARRAPHRTIASATRSCNSPARRASAVSEAGPIDRDADVGEAVRSAAQAAHREGHAMAQRQPVRRQLLLLHQLFERGTIGSSGGR